MNRPRTPQKGSPITWEHIAYLYWLADRELTVVPPLAKASDGTIYLGATGGMWIKIAGAPGGTGGNAYPWQELQELTAGGWIPRVRSGTATADPAYELNGSTASLTGKIVRAWRDPASNEVRFLWSSC
jgi:hypothetical protein